MKYPREKSHINDPPLNFQANGFKKENFIFRSIVSKVGDGGFWRGRKNFFFLDFNFFHVFTPCVRFFLFFPNFSNFGGSDQNPKVHSVLDTISLGWKKNLLPQLLRLLGSIRKLVMNCHWRRLLNSPRKTCWIQKDLLHLSKELWIALNTLN